MIIRGRMIHTSDEGLHHNANNDTILGNVGFEIKEVMSYTHRLHELLTMTFGRYVCPPIILPTDKNINVFP